MSIAGDFGTKCTQVPSIVGGTCEQLSSTMEKSSKVPGHWQSQTDDPQVTSSHNISIHISCEYIHIYIFIYTNFFLHIYILWYTFFKYAYMHIYICIFVYVYYIYACIFGTIVWGTAPPLDGWAAAIRTCRGSPRTARTTTRGPGQAPWVPR
jgi:hypothetical protein